MSTTNIDEQKMQQISSSDTIKDFMEKCNNNFSIISKYGSGPEGKQGVEGSQGVPTKPKVPIHVWREGVEYYNETSSDDGYVINSLTVNLADSNYQEGHLIMLKNGHVYILKEDEESKLLKPNYIMALQSYNQDDVIDGKSAYIHIAYANSTEPDYIDFITNEELQKQEKENVGNGEIKYKYMGIYSDCNENPNKDKPYIYTWIRIVGDTGEKGDKGDKGDTPTSTSVEVVGYSLEDLNLDSEYWESSISDLGELKPGTPIYIKNRYTWNDGTVTYGKTVTMAGTQGIKGETGRVLFYLGSFEDGTLTGDTVTGYLNDYRCDYYIDITGQAWMRTGTAESAEGHMFGKDNVEDNWVQSDKVGFLQAGAITADMINVETLAADEAFINEMVANKAFINNLVADEAVIKKIQSTEISAGQIKTGRISSTNNNGVESYFDLDNGTFALGNALTYDGSGLSIKGVPDEDRIEEILTGLVGDIDIEIGGRNLLRNTETMKSWTPSGYSDSTVSSTTDTLKGKDAAKVTGTGGNDKYKVNYSLMEHTDEHFDTTRPYALSFNFKALNYTQCVRVNLKQNKSDESEWLEVIKLAPDEEKRITFIGYLTENTNLQLCMGAEYWDNNENSKFRAEFVINEMKLEYGTVVTDWTPAPEDVDDSIQALEYLKTALENTTDITGGIVATTSIQLRDWTGNYLSDDKKEYKVNAGLSGKCDDNVLLWGGGTYLEAVNAAKDDNDFHKQPGKGDTQITTLIKKDGQGKIGIFKISDTQAIVKTNQGEIVIDAADYNDGIFIRNNNGENKITIKNGLLGSDIIPQEDSGSGSKSFSFNTVLCSGSSGTCSTQRTADLWTDMLDTYSGGTNTVTVSFEDVSFRQMLRYFGATPTGNTTVKIILYAKSGSSYSKVSTKTLTLENVTSGSNYVAELTYQSFSLSYTTKSHYTFELGVEVNGQDHYACLGDFMMQGNVKWSWSWKPDVVPHTVIGTDGFATIYDSSKYFMIQNTSNGQQIYAKGLKKTKGTSGSGELYVSNTSNEGLLKTLKDAFGKISEVLNIAKYEGSDADAQTAATTAISNVIDELDKISIIANS